MGKNLEFAPHEKPWRYEEGEFTVTRGSAWSGPGCHLGCGVLEYTDKDGKLVKVEGDPDNPYNQGRLCVRCLDVQEATNHPDRLQYPMRRAREDRGKNAWERISWDEALDEVAATFSDIREKYGAEGVLFLQGTARDIAPYLTRLAWSFGSPNYTNILSGVACFAPRIVSMAASTGCFWVSDCAQQFADRYDNPAFKVPDVMFVWGNYPLKSNSDGFYGHWVVDLMKRGMDVVMIDPKVTWLSARAKKHLRVRPGTDAALALGMLNVIINEDLYDHDFVEKWCYGFDELAKRVQEYPPSMVSEITWVPEEDIKEAARILAAADGACMQWGVAVDMTREALPAGQAIAALFQITGNVDNPGGNVMPTSILNYVGGWGDEFMTEEQKSKRIGLNDYGIMQIGATIAHPDLCVKAMQTGEPYPIRAVWLQTTNPLACTSADPSTMLDALMNVPYIAAVDIFMTPTIMAVADLVMPACTFPERNGLRLGDGHQRAEAINKACERIGECKSDMEINLALGKRLRPEAWPWETAEEMFTAMLEPTGLTFEDLREKGPGYMPFEYYRYEKGLLRPDGQVGFNTPTGRIELYSNLCTMIGLDPLPYFEEPEPGPTSTPELLEEYPLVLTTGARNWGMFHSENRQMPRLRRLRPDPLVEMHPDTCNELGLSDGDWVWVENQLGRAKRRLKATREIHKRMASTDHGWWLPESSPEELCGSFEYNINNLIPWGKVGKSGFGANYKTCLVKIYKVKDGE